MVGFIEGSLHPRRYGGGHVKVHIIGGKGVLRGNLRHTYLSLPLQKETQSIKNRQRGVGTLWRSRIGEL